MGKKWYVATAAAVTAAVVGVAAGGVYYNRQPHAAPGETIAAPAARIHPATPSAPADPELAAKLSKLASDPRLGHLVGQVSEGGNVVWEQDPTQPVRPASTTKLLTAAAALLTLGEEDRLTTQLLDAGNGTVVLKAGGDVMLDDAALAKLAAGTPKDTKKVVVDTSIWPDDAFNSTWKKDDIGGGYIAPIQPVMVHGARIGGTEGELPRSSTPALDAGRALASRIGGAAVELGTGQGNVLAESKSPQLADRLRDMMYESDNVMAEALGREVAVARHQAADFGGATQAVRDTFAEHGFDTTGLTLKDTSGLSEDNRIPPALLNSVLANEDLHGLLASLPIAAAEGTLASRFQHSPGAGWVRAKTGTLTGTSGLAGTVTSRTGHVYTFALVSNDSEISAAREGLDAMASALR